MASPKVLAFLLPQFHRIPENDAWWGEGFTEWTNVEKARSRFAGHRQPRVPQGARYYDLTSPITQEWQAELARAHGIAGFCYYHYWFNGKQLLEAPLGGVVERRTPDFPFCIAWANEPWTRAWDGGDRHILMPQNYGAEPDWEAHFRCLEPMFHDPRYIRVDGRPVVLIYRSANIGPCAEMLALWRQLALKSGLPGLHIVSMLTIFGRDTRADLFDAYVEFEPTYTQAILPMHYKLYERVVNRISKISWRLMGTSFCAPRSRDYRLFWRDIVNRKRPPGQYPGAFVDWDNSPRKDLKTSLVMRNVSVDAFRKGFSHLFAKATRAGSPFIFINAWNEWAEGTYLEPDEERGMAYLEVIKAVVGKDASSQQHLSAQGNKGLRQHE